MPTRIPKPHMPTIVAAVIIIVVALLVYHFVAAHK